MRYSLDRADRIFLVGMMGSGKSTIGALLATELRYHFVDLDKLLESSQERTISTIFREDGEEHFRILERDMLRSMVTLHRVVIATGGGAPCFWDGMKVMNVLGRSCYLRATLSTLLSRLHEAQEVRPLLKGNSDEQVRLLLQQRMNRYEQAHCMVDVDEKSPIEVIVSIKDVLGMY